MTRTTLDPCTDLHWYFNDCGGELSGLKSSHDTLVAMAQGTSSKSGSHAPDGPQESPRAMGAARKERPIRATLGELTPLQQRVLRAHYTRRSHREYDVRYPDGHAGVVLLQAGGIWPQHDRDGVWMGRATVAVIDAQQAYRDAWRVVSPRLRSDRWASAMRADTAFVMGGFRTRGWTR